MGQKHKSILSEVKSPSIIDPLLLVHCFIVGLTLSAYGFSWVTSPNAAKFIGGYSILLNLVLIFSLHKRLQSWLIYMQWLLVAILQLCTYIIISNSIYFVKSSGLGLSSLRGLFVFLILYQIFRQLSLKSRQNELELRGKNSSMENTVDFVAFYVIFFTTIIATVYPAQ